MRTLAQRIKGVYVVTDEQLAPGRTHEDIARAALAGGASVIQLRDKMADDRRLIEAGMKIARMASEAGALFIVNDRVEVALACHADGIHIGQEDRPVSEVRRLMPQSILGVSAATPEEAVRAEREGADCLGIGPIFSTSTKPDAGDAVGLERIAEIRAVCGLPIVAIGGISLSNIREVARAGADSAAVISAIVCAEDMTAATAALVAAFASGQ
jgi:thiamine-phosphate pyrophosphorylase